MRKLQASYSAQTTLTIGKYVISGAATALVNLGVLFLLTEYARLYYLGSAIAAFVLAFFTSFFLQKFWTFRDSRIDKLHIQLTSYFVLAILNLLLNTIFLYLLVERFHVWYVFSEAFVMFGLAFFSFFVYRHVIFNMGIFRHI